MKVSPRLIIFLVVFVDLMGFGIMIPMLPFYARSFDASAAEVGYLMFVYSAMQFILGPVWGRLSDRFGRKPILMFTIFGQGLAFLWGGLAWGYLSLLLSRLCAGLFAGNISVASAYMADITSHEQRSKGMGLIGAAIGLGFIFGPAVGGVLFEQNESFPALIASVICFLNLVFVLLALREPLSSSWRRGSNRNRVFWSTLKSVLMDVRLIGPVFLVFLVTFAFVQMEITFGLFVYDQFGFSERQAGFLFALMGIVMALVQGLAIGKLVKLIGEARLVFLGLFLSLAGLGGISLSDSIGMLLVSLSLLAVGFSLVNPCLAGLLSKATDDNTQGSVLGVYQSGSSLARVVGPGPAGHFYDFHRSFPYMVGALVVFLGIFFWGVKVLRFSLRKQSSVFDLHN